MAPAADGSDAAGAHARPTGTRGGCDGTYFVECYCPGITKELTDEALVTIGQRQQAADTANCVRSLACILVPSDGMAFFLFSGPSLADIQEVAGLIQLPFDRIVESVVIVLYSTASER